MLILCCDCFSVMSPFQHISSRRHKDRSAGKPAKPKYSPYSKPQKGQTKQPVSHWCLRRLISIKSLGVKTAIIVFQFFFLFCHFGDICNSPLEIAEYLRLFMVIPQFQPVPVSAWGQPNKNQRPGGQCVSTTFFDVGKNLLSLSS